MVGPGEGVASSSVYRRASVAYSTMTHNSRSYMYDVLLKVQWNLSLYEDTPELRTPLNRTPFPTPSTTLVCISTSEMRTPH